MTLYHVKKNVLPILVLIFFGECKKSFTPQENETILQSKSSNKLIQNISKWGVISNGSTSSSSGAEGTMPLYYLTPVNKVSLAKEYGATYIRTGLSKAQWDTSKDGFLYTYDQYTDNGFRVLLNITWKEALDPNTGILTPVPFVVNARNINSSYNKFVQEVIDTLSAPGHVKPAVIVVENEETNKNYHVLNDTNDYRDYINMVVAVVAICKPKGIGVTNGGLTARALTFATNDWLKKFPKRVQEAQTYAENSMPSSAYYTLYPPCPKNVSPIGKDNIAGQVNMVNFYISNYADIDIDAINVHWYEPVKVRYWDDSKNDGSPWQHSVNKNEISDGAMDGMIEYVSKVGFPRKVISNEIGQLTTSDCLTKAIMNNIDAIAFGAFNIASWYDGDGGELYGSKALHNTFQNEPLYKLRNTGTMFQQIIANPESNRNCSPLK